MGMYIYMLLVALGATGLADSVKNFRGSNENIKLFLNAGSIIGYASLLAFTVYAMFHISWWKPIVGVIVCVILSGILDALMKFIPGILKDILYILLILVCSFLMWNYF